MLRLLSLCSLSLALFSPPALAIDFDHYELGEFYRLSQVDEPVVEEAAKAVVSFSGATGFVISPDGWILTNHHVYTSFGDRGTVTLERRPGGANRRLPVRFVMADEARDIALYRTTARELPFLRVRTTAPRVGETVFVLGHPHSWPQRASFGTVLANAVDIDGKISVEYSAQTWWGSSGSPVLDAKGRALGIHWGWDAEGVSNGRLTGIPFNRIIRFVPRVARVVTGHRSRRVTRLAAPSARARRPALPTRCTDPALYSIQTELMKPNVATNRQGRSLDSVKVALASSRPECLGRIHAVRYRLHPTFSNPLVAGDQGTRGFPVSLRAWGYFETTAEVTFADARRPIRVSGWVRWSDR